jgi:hypothetical protein
MKRLQFRENWDEIRKLLDAFFSPIPAKIRSPENYLIEIPLATIDISLKFELWRYKGSGGVTTQNLQTLEPLAFTEFLWSELIFFDKNISQVGKTQELNYFILVKYGLHMGDLDLILKVWKNGGWTFRGMDHIDFMTHLRQIHEIEAQD